MPRRDEPAYFWWGCTVDIYCEKYGPVVKTFNIAYCASASDDPWARVVRASGTNPRDSCSEPTNVQSAIDCRVTAQPCRSEGAVRP